MTIEGMPTPTPGPFAYTVQTGDTLNAIALRFGADPIEIIEFNNLLAPGQSDGGHRDYHS